MKLIYCRQCHNLIQLDYDWIECTCGSSGGHYHKNGDTITVWGNCKVIGILNEFFKPNGAETIKALNRDVMFWYPETNGKVTRLTKRG